MKPSRIGILAFPFFLLAGTVAAQSVRDMPPNAGGAALRPKRDAREASELERLRPLVQQLIDGGALEPVNEMLATVRYSRVLGPETKRELLHRLEVRRVVLLGKRARAELAHGEIGPARATMQQAQGALDALVTDGAEDLQPARASLSSAQAELFLRLTDRARAFMDRNDLANAEQTLRNASAILAATEFADPDLAERSEKIVGDAEHKLARFKQNRSLERARGAEQQGDLRLARLLFARAVEEGDTTQAPQELLRIEQMRRAPGLDLGLSLVVPGLGQLNAGRHWTAAGFFVGTGLTLTSGILLVVAGDDRYEQYRQAGPQTDGERIAELYDGVNARWTGALVLFGVAAGLYLWNLIDAYASDVSWNRRVFSD